MLLLTLRGTPTLYYGDEIGMADVPIPPGLVQDPWEKNVRGIGLGRDPERTPMQWDASPNAGFTTGTPWLPVAADYEKTNVAAQRDDPRSVLSLHRALLTLRRAEPALSAGSHTQVAASDDLLAYVREGEGRRFLVVLNMGAESRTFDGASEGRVVLSTGLDREGEEVSGALELRGDEGMIVALR
jgi:alpha-glucosidase